MTVFDPFNNNVQSSQGRVSPVRYSSVSLENRETTPPLPSPDAFQMQGAALARDPQLERLAPWIVVGFTVAFALFLIIMNLAGQAPGQSFPLKGISDVLQFVGEAIGLLFCVRIALRLQRATAQAKLALRQQQGQVSQQTLNMMRAEAQATQRAFLAWTLLAIGVGLYACGQAVWTSYDVRMPSSAVPFPGLYDIGFVASYPFFLIGTLFLARRNRATVRQTRLVLDAVAVLGAALALSWFFVLQPSIAGLAKAPSPGAAFLSIYFPTGDLFLVAVGTLLMFSPLSHLEQRPVFIRLCSGLFFLAVTDSLLGYFNFTPTGFNTGTLQDILWPLSMMMVGLAAIEYPASIEREQVETAQQLNGRVPIRPVSQWSLTAQTVTPFLFALFTCAILLTIVPTLGGRTILIEADILALALFLIVAVRQALTMTENNRLAMQIRGELVISRRELQVQSRIAGEATQAAQEKQILEEGVQILQQVHTQVSRGNFSVRADISQGPLLPIASSLNLMLERLTKLAQRAEAYEQLTRDIPRLQEALERLGRGYAPWTAQNGQLLNQTSVELRPLFLGVNRSYQTQITSWLRVKEWVESMRTMGQHLEHSVKRVPAVTEAEIAERNALLDQITRLEVHVEEFFNATKAMLARFEEGESIEYHHQPSPQSLPPRRTSGTRTPNPGMSSSLSPSSQDAPRQRWR